MKARNWENIRKDDCLPTVRGQNLQGNLTTVLHRGLSPDPLLLLAFLSTPFFFLLKHVTTCPASNHAAVELGLVLFRVSFKLLAYPGVWDFLPCGTFLSVVLFQQMAVRGAEWVQPSPTLQTLWQPPCPCSQAHSATPAGVLMAHTGKAVTGKEPQIQQERSTLHFLPPRPICVCCTGVLVVCLPVHFRWETELVQGCGTRTVWPPARVPHRCVSWDLFTSALAAEPAQAVCFHWLEPAFCQFLPFLACQLMPVNTNNIDASAFQPQLWKQIPSPAEL